ncbi:hypothetical protein B0T18DRAFT_429594 [Schizothecium vesticola]|uniref:Uncharacterized protein n=1 Tax=Schizothecium vesticola TaxID=314040 RepID=A0AA40K5I0_9PEZI|nr:hypothetical protein B0T18DRAFT_429594 [Schizothecium vesticola]
MRTTSVLFAALVAASSVASHDTQPPRRMFYPRHVKRQFTNITVPPEEITTTTESETAKATTTTGQQSFNEVVEGVIENLFPTVSSTLTSSGEGVQSTPFVSPTLSSNSTTETTENTESLTDVKSQSSSTVVSVAEPVAISTSSSIVLWPTTAITTDAPETTPTTTPDPTTSKTDPLSSLFSEIEDILTSALPRPNVTTIELPTTTIIPIPDVTTTPSGTGPVTEPPVITTTTPPPEPPITTTTSSPIVDPPPISSNTTTPDPPPETTTATSKPPDVITTTPSATTTPPPVITTTASGNGTDPIVTTSVSTSGDGVTSIAPTRTVTNSQSWLPTTVLLDSTSSTTVAAGLAPTTATGIPTELPRAINPPSAAPQPEDTEIIQIGLLQGYNYRFVVDETKAAAQVFNLLPKALSYAAGSDDSKVKARDEATAFKSKIMARKLQPLDTVSSLGYLTTVVLVSYPRHLIESLRMDIKLPSSALYNNPDPLVYNFTKQINPAIDITLGSGIDLPSFGDGKGDAPGSPGKNDPFGNGNKDEKDSGKQAATAGIVTGAVAVAAAYGVAMFVIARRYKKKKQAHRRASSLTGSGRSSPSDMQETYRGSPAMGGALLSRDFTSNSNYGGVSSGGRERDSRGSHGSGKSGMNTSSRTQYISAPVGAQNSLGWN